MKKCILFIDDDELLGDVLTQKIRNEGYEVTLVRDGADGLQELRAEKPDLMLLDLVLPSMNGYEILEAKKKDPAIADVPVIIISNSGQPVDVERAHALGVKDYLLKGQLAPEDVVLKIRGYLGPGEKPDTAKAGSTTAEHQRLAGRKILWIEDDQFLSSILAVKLSHEGSTCLYAKDGEEAMGILEREIPDIILLDLLLPGMTGFEVLEKIRADARFTKVPVIILSNLGQKEDQEKCAQLGATKYLIKAEHDLEDIVNEVAKTLAEAK